MPQRKPLPLLADLLQADPDLERRLKEAGRWHRVDVRWALGSVPTTLETGHAAYPAHPWRSEQEAAIQEIRATAAGTKRRKAGP